MSGEMTKARLEGILDRAGSIREAVAMAGVTRITALNALCARHGLMPASTVFAKRIAFEAGDDDAADAAPVMVAARARSIEAKWEKLMAGRRYGPVRAGGAA